MLCVFVYSSSLPSSWTETECAINLISANVTQIQFSKRNEKQSDGTWAKRVFVYLFIYFSLKNEINSIRWQRRRWQYKRLNLIEINKRDQFNESIALSIECAFNSTMLSLSKSKRQHQQQPQKEKTPDEINQISVNKIYIKFLIKLINGNRGAYGSTPVCWLARSAAVRKSMGEKWICAQILSIMWLWLSGNNLELYCFSSVLLSAFLRGTNKLWALWEFNDLTQISARENEARAATTTTT